MQADACAVLQASWKELQMKAVFDLNKDGKVTVAEIFVCFCVGYTVVTLPLFALSWLLG